MPKGEGSTGANKSQRLCSLRKGRISANGILLQWLVIRRGDHGSSPLACFCVFCLNVLCGSVGDERREFRQSVWEEVLGRQNECKV